MDTNEYVKMNGSGAQGFNHIQRTTDKGGMLGETDSHLLRTLYKLVSNGQP